MRMVDISLPATERVQEFVGTITALKGDFELLSGQYVLDARSLMGIFSLDLTQPIKLKIYNDSQDNMDAIAPFLAEKSGGRRDG
ncbi:HPr family phosphocarrier protein [Ruminococcaceae bacterium OttesenSCG-928-D13]|nr:HPr family phosphocarrier protein [Ruminococcaceae bacterium OttesenSCG-928-D13]